MTEWQNFNKAALAWLESTVTLPVWAEIILLGIAMMCGAGFGRPFGWLAGGLFVAALVGVGMLERGEG